MNLLEAISKALDGKKTYFIAALLAFATFSLTIGWIDQRTYELVQGVLLPAGLAALRAGVGK